MLFTCFRAHGSSICLPAAYSHRLFGCVDMRTVGSLTGLKKRIDGVWYSEIWLFLWIAVAGWLEPTTLAFSAMESHGCFVTIIHWKWISNGVAILQVSKIPTEIQKRSQICIWEKLEEFWLKAHRGNLGKHCRTQTFLPAPCRRAEGRLWKQVQAHVQQHLVRLSRCMNVMFWHFHYICFTLKLLQTVNRADDVLHDVFTVR